MCNVQCHCVGPSEELQEKAGTRSAGGSFFNATEATLPPVMTFSVLGAGVVAAVSVAAISAPAISCCRSIPADAPPVSAFHSCVFALLSAGR